VDIVVKSESYSDGNTASAMVNSEEVIPNPSRGLNAVVLNAAYSVLASRVFDTYANASQSSAFATWIDTHVTTEDLLILAVK
jgi:hypothetical protein